MRPTAFLALGALAGCYLSHRLPTDVDAGDAAEIDAGPQPLRGRVEVGLGDTGYLTIAAFVHAPFERFRPTVTLAESGGCQHVHYLPLDPLEGTDVGAITLSGDGREVFRMLPQPAPGTLWMAFMSGVVYGDGRFDPAAPDFIDLGRTERFTVTGAGNAAFGPFSAELARPPDVDARITEAELRVGAGLELTWTPIATDVVEVTIGVPFVLLDGEVRCQAAGNAGRLVIDATVLAPYAEHRAAGAAVAWIDVASRSVGRVPVGEGEVEITVSVGQRLEVPLR